MGFSDEVNETQKEMGGDSDFYKFKEGDNKLHILTEPKIKVSRYNYGICYEGAPYCQQDVMDKEYAKALEDAKAAGKNPKDVSRPNLSKKWMCWAINRATGGLVLVDIPYGVSKTLKEFMESDEAGFKSWPMPYGINIKAKGAGKKTVEYEVIASRKETPITEEELAELAKKATVESILERMKQKQKDKMEGKVTDTSGGIEYPTDDINPEDIPF